MRAPLQSYTNARQGWYTNKKDTSQDAVMRSLAGSHLGQERFKAFFLFMAKGHEHAACQRKQRNSYPIGRGIPRNFARPRELRRTDNSTHKLP